MAEENKKLTVCYLLDRHNAQPLTRQTKDSVGYDIKAIESDTVPANSWKVIETGVKLALPKGHVGKIFSRSGLAANHGITAQAGVIDSDYRDTIKVKRIAALSVVLKSVILID